MRRRSVSGDEAVAIAVGDLHAGNLHPRCRERDDYFEVLLKKIHWICELGTELQVPVFQAGDLFDHWSQPPTVLNAVAAALKTSARSPKTRWECTIGQHDVPNHDLQQIKSTAWQNMRLAEVIDYRSSVDCYGWGAPIHACSNSLGIALAHVSTWMKPYAPGQAPVEAMRTLARFVKQGYRLVITGDNHSRFSYVDKAGNILINPGSVMRMTADQADHVPSVTVIHRDESGAYRLEHRTIPVIDEIRPTEVEEANVMDERIETFVKRLGESQDVTLSFRDNLKKVAKGAKASAGVISILKECTRTEEGK